MAEFEMYWWYAKGVECLNPNGWSDIKRERASNYFTAALGHALSDAIELLWVNWDDV